MRMVVVCGWLWCVDGCGVWVVLVCGCSVFGRITCTEVNCIAFCRSKQRSFQPCWCVWISTTPLNSLNQGQTVRSAPLHREQAVNTHNGVTSAVTVTWLLTWGSDVSGHCHVTADIWGVTSAVTVTWLLTWGVPHSLSVTTVWVHRLL